MGRYASASSAFTGWTCPTHSARLLLRPTHDLVLIFDGLEDQVFSQVTFPRARSALQTARCSPSEIRGRRTSAQRAS